MRSSSRSIRRSAPLGPWDGPVGKGLDDQWIPLDLKMSPLRLSEMKRSLGRVAPTATKPEQKPFWFCILFPKIVTYFLKFFFFFLRHLRWRIRLKLSLLKQLFLVLWSWKNYLPGFGKKRITQGSDEHTISFSTNPEMKCKCNTPLSGRDAKNNPQAPCKTFT